MFEIFKKKEETAGEMMERKIAEARAQREAMIETGEQKRMEAKEKTKRAGEI